ncbi:MAG TPA: hypothetical protein VMW23_10840 [Sedimentisphaerales bacterium]|nr:hypothetical protein [Sedimentisphaerales bacterium]
MEPEMNQKWNDECQTQNQTNPCEQPQMSSSARCQWLQQTWLNMKVTTWLKCLIIAVVLTMAAIFIAPKFTCADNQQQNPRQDAMSSAHSQLEDYWSDYEYYKD